MAVPDTMDDADMSTASGIAPPLATEAHYSSYRLFLGDTEGAFKSFEAPQPADIPAGTGPSENQSCSLPKPVELVQGAGAAGAAAKKTSASAAEADGERAAQKMASGVLNGVGWVVAVARRNATVEVIAPPQRSQPSEEGPSSSTESPNSTSQRASQATIVATIRDAKMKAGIQRWIGLAVGKAGIYACTSAGSFTYTPLSVDIDAATPSNADTPALKAGETVTRDFPEPLQSCIFYPSADPRCLLYGGEEIPLSMWDLEAVVSGCVSEKDSHDDEKSQETSSSKAGQETSNGHAEGGNANMRKRKRQAEARAKAKELLPGEVWRAKNLPNDALSLPQRPNITSIAVLGAEDTAPGSDEEAVSDTQQVLPSKLTVAVGTRDGLLRIFEPGSNIRKHIKEFRVVVQGQGSLKLLSARHCTAGSEANSGELAAADSAGKLYAVDWRGGKVRYQWKDITGSITSIVPLEVQKDADSHFPLLFTTSHDRMLRLHTWPLPAAATSKQEGTGSSTKTNTSTFVSHSERGRTILSVFTGGAAAVAAVWDGQIPQSTQVGSRTEAMEEGDESMRRHGHSDGDEDEVWEAMQEVGDERDADGKKQRKTNLGGAASASGVAADKAKPSRGDRGSAGKNGAAADTGSADDEEERDEEVVKEERSKRNRK